MRYNLNIWLFADKPYGCFKSYQGLRFFLKSLHIKARVKKTIIRFSTKEDCYKFMDGLMVHKKFNVFDLRFDVDVRTMNNQKCDLDGNILPTFKRRVIA